MNRFYPPLRRSLQLALLLLLPVSPVFAAVHTPAETALQEGRIDQAVSILRSAIAANPNDALSHNLLCRAYYAEDLPDSAVPECEAAVARNSSSSDFTLWLGRAYGMKAEHGGPLTGLTMAKRVRAMFEHAVELDHSNPNALSDLGEFYVSAPSMIGGSYDKAARMAAQLMPISPMRSHRLLGQLAEKRGDLSGAEKEFKAETVAEHNADSFVDLGLFYCRHKRNDEAVVTLKTATELDREGDSSLVDVASGLNDIKRESQFAIQVLRRYLESPARSEAAPAPRVHVLLGRILVQNGDAAAGRREFEAALGLASAYVPARAELKK